MTDSIPDTRFTLHGYGTVPGSARGLTYRYKPVTNGTTHTDFAGKVWWTGRPALKNLFVMTLSCTDVCPPGFASLNIGDAVVFDGLPWQQRASDGLFLPVAAGSTPIFTDANGNLLPGSASAAWCEWCPGNVAAVLEDFDVEHQEWEQSIRWSLVLRMTR